MEDVLFASEAAISSQILLYQTPSYQWVQSDVYNFIDMVEGLRVMYTDGVANKVMCSSNSQLYALFCNHNPNPIDIVFLHGAG